MVERYDAIVIGLGGMGSASAYHLARRGSGARAGAVRPAPRARFVARADPDHPAGLPRAPVVRPAAAPRVRALARPRGRCGRAAPDHDRVARGRARGRVATFRGALEAAELHDIPHEVLDAAELRRRYPGVRRLRRLDAGRVPARRRLPARRADDPGARQRRAGGRRRPALPRAGRCAGSRSARACGSRPSAGRYEADRLVVCRGRVGADAGASPRAGWRCRSARCSPGSSRHAGAVRARSLPGLPDRRRGGQLLRIPGPRRARLQVRLLPPLRASRSTRPIRRPLGATRRRGAAARLRRALLPRRHRPDGDAQGLHLHELARRALPARHRCPTRPR